MERDDSLPIRFVLLDDDDVARNRSVARLRRNPAIDIVGDASDSREALRLARELRPDGVLVDVHQRSERGLAAIALLSSIKEPARPAVVAYLEIIHRDAWPEARSAGADDLVLQELPAQILASELRSIVQRVRGVRP